MHDVIKSRLNFFKWSTFQVNLTSNSSIFAKMCLNRDTFPLLCTQVSNIKVIFLKCRSIFKSFCARCYKISSKFLEMVNISSQFNFQFVNICQKSFTLYPSFKHKSDFSEMSINFQVILCTML